MRYLLALVCLCMYALGWAVPPLDPTPEQAQRVQAVLATVTADDATVAAAVAALVQEGDAILPALEQSKAVDSGAPEVPVLVQRQAAVVREAITRLRWGCDPQTVLQAELTRTKPADRTYLGRPLTVTDPAVVATFPAALFYVVRWVPGSEIRFDGLASVKVSVFVVGRDRTVKPLPDATALEAYFKAHAPVLPTAEVTPSVGGGKAQEIPGTPLVRAAAYSWARVYALIAYGIRLKIDPTIRVQVETAMTNAIGAQPRSWITGAVTATPAAPADGLSGNDLSGTLAAVLSFSADTGKLVAVTHLDRIRRVPVAAPGR